MEVDTNPPKGYLLRVYPPDGAEDNTSVDIIAIHGLGTTTPRTWEHKTNAGTVNWLSDSNMLPDIVPSARIYTFSWNANYSADAPVIRILNVAEILLSNLKRHRDQDDTHSRPLVFVASCFGGLVVTKALEIANIHDSVYRKVLVATSGVVFLGSPLQGTRASKAAEWHVMIAGILNRHPSQTLLQDLDGSTTVLRETTDQFVHMITTPPLQMMTMCFWETQKSQVLKAVLPTCLRNKVPRMFSSTKMILVEKDSAVLLGRSKKPLDAPHSKMNKFDGPGDANFGLVSDEIREMVKDAKRIAVNQREAHHLHNEHFIVSRRPNPLFTGREEELGKLKQALCPSLSTTAHNAVPKIYVIQGMGGAGKSEVALKFAHDNRPEFWGIFWIDGRSESSITNGFVTIARTCGHHEESLEGAMSWLQNTSHSWLLIIDNADNENLDLAHFLPAGKHGSILITTRLTECTHHETVGKDNYERLDQKTAVDLLLKACGTKMCSRSAHEDNARVVTELLGCHALAIVQAGAAIREGICDLVEYQGIFQDQRQTLFQHFPTQGGSEYGGVYATFEVSAAYLEARNGRIAKDALHLLSFYAYMHFTDFPEAAFEEAWNNSRDENVVSSGLSLDGEEKITNLAPWHVSHLPKFMRQKPQTVNFDKVCFRQARSLLASLSLIAFDSVRATTRMHPVSHFWSRDRLQKPEESMKATLNGLSVLSLSIKSPFGVDTDPWMSQLLPHIEFIADSLKGWDAHEWKFHFKQSLFRFSCVMYDLNYDTALFELLRMIPIQANRSWVGTENGQCIQVLHARSLREFGDANKGVILLETLNESYMQTLAAEDGRMLSMQHELARAYLEIEETTKAITLLESVVEIQTRTLRPEHSDRLTSQHELARAYLEIEETTKAITLLESVVEIETRTLGPEHSSRLTSQHVLASAYLEIEETTKAITLLEPVVGIETRTLRPEHSSRLTSQHVLARAYLRIEETTKAITLLESVVEIETRTLRPEHPDRMASIFVLARCYYKARKYERALELARSIEDVAKNGPRGQLADLNTNLIGDILKEMDLDEAS